MQSCIMMKPGHGDIRIQGQCAVQNYNKFGVPYSTLPELHLVQSPETQPTYTAGLLPYEHSLPLKAS